MASNYFPAGFEEVRRGDYFDSDDEDVGDIVYPDKINTPTIKVSPASEKSEDGEILDIQEEDVNVVDNKDKSSSESEEVFITPDEERSKREYSVNRYDPDEKTDRENELKNHFLDDDAIVWFKEGGPVAQNSEPGSTPTFHSRETRSPSPAVLLLDELRLATMDGNLSYIESAMKINHGFFIDTVLKNGWTMLMFACDFGYHDIVQYCLENNADPNFHYDNFTPLMAACQSFYADEDKVVLIVKYLIKFGANIDSKDLSRKTALMYACETGKVEVATLLVQLGADIALKDCKQWTALHFAAKRGFGPVVRQLINHGADLKVYNNVGQSPSDIALEAGFHELGTLMERLRCKESTAIEEYEILSKPISKKAPFTSFKPNFLTELEYFLGENGLEDYCTFFEEQQLTYEDILLFNEADLDALNIEEYGVKLKLWEGIKKEHRKLWKPSNVSQLQRKSQISCPEAIVLLRNISNHLKHMDVTIKYLHNHLKNDPEMVSREEKVANIDELVNQCENTIDQGDSLIFSMKSFSQDVNGKTVTSNGCDTRIPEIQPEESTPYRKTLIISGLCGLFGTIAYFQKDSISSIFSRK